MSYDETEDDSRSPGRRPGAIPSETETRAPGQRGIMPGAERSMTYGSGFSSISMSSVDSERLPVYLLLDCSGSMEGAYIQAVRRGVEIFRDEVLDQEPARQIVHVGIITFNSRAELVTGEDLVPIRRLQIPELVARGKTRLGEALQLLQTSIDRQVRKPVLNGLPGDYKPLVFILTDGEPTDEDVWRPARESLRRRIDRKVLNVVTVGCGPDINKENLSEIAMGDTYIMLDDAAAAFHYFFQFIAQSTVDASVACNEGRESDAPRARKPAAARNSEMYLGHY